MFIVEVISHFPGSIDKPVVTSFMGEAKVKPGIDRLEKFGIPNYPFPERAALALLVLLVNSKVLWRWKFIHFLFLIRS